MIATNLVDRLNGATSYRELQDVFQELVSQARTSPDQADLAHAIDEVVRRLQQERARDEQELREIQSRYEAFQSQHQGVVGWFKRHLPFTETRRQETEHRGELADQQAEILADNLVIARAQMIKERLLAPSERKLGRRPPEWRSQVEQSRLQDLAAQGQVLKELHGELERSGHFIRELKSDIDAFGSAAFKADDDRRRRDADLAAARGELAELDRELHEEQAIEKAGLAEVARRVTDELSRTSVPFQDAHQRLAQLNAAAEQLKETGDALDRLHKAAAEAGAKARQLLDLPTEVQRARDALLKVNSKQIEAGGLAERKRAAFHAQRDPYERARLDCEQKRQLLASAQQFYDAYQTERQAAGTTGVEGETSPVAWRYQEAKTAAEQAEAELRRATPPYEAALKEMEDAQKAADALSKEYTDAKSKVAALEERAPQLRLELTTELDRAQPLVANAAAALAAYVGQSRTLESALRFDPQPFAAGAYGWLGSSGFERGFGQALLEVQADYPRHQQALAILLRLTQWRASVATKMSEEQKQVRDRRQAIFRGRCREVLGDTLAEAAEQAAG